MEITTKIENDCLIVKLTGELDMHSVQQFKEKVNIPLEENELKYLILDIRNVSFIDSSGLGVILGRYRELKKRGGKVVLIKPKAQVRKIFRMAGMLKIMPVYNNIKQVLNDLREGGMKGA